MKGKALLAGCIALVMSSAALAEDIKIAVVGRCPARWPSTATVSLPAQSRR